MQANFAMFHIGAVNRLANAGPGSGDHLGVHPQFTTIAHLNPMRGGIGIKDRGNVVLGMHGGKEHPRHRQNPLAARRAQTVQTVADHRVGKFEIAVFHQPVIGQITRQFIRQHAEFIDRRLAARAVPADHHTCFDHAHASCGASSVLSSSTSSVSARSLRARSPDQRPIAIAAPSAAAPSQCPCPATSARWPGWA